MEGHKARVQDHIDRLGSRPETDVLGFMLKSRIEAMSRSIAETRKKIEATERAYDLLESYSYSVDPPADASAGVKLQPMSGAKATDKA
jgi:hypothetical protein